MQGGLALRNPVPAVVRSCNDLAGDWTALQRSLPFFSRIGV